MDSFYLIIVIIAVIVLIIALTFIGLTLKKTIQESSLTIHQNPCPDYWKLSDDGTKCIIPYGDDPKNLGILTLSGDKYDLVDNSMNEFTRKIRGNVSVSDASYYAIDMNAASWTTASGYNGMSLSCAHKQWATDLNIAWDGVSNAPCKKN